MNELKKVIDWDAGIEKSLIKPVLIISLIAGILFFILFVALIPTGNNPIIGLAICTSLFFMCLVFVILSLYLFIKNIMLYKTDKSSLMLTRYGPSTYSLSMEKGIFHFIFSQAVVLMLLLTFTYVLYLMVKTIMSILGSS